MTIGNLRLAIGNLFRSIAKANFFLFFLCPMGLAHAWWDAGGITPPAYNDSPQHACEYLGIDRVGQVLPYRIAWVRYEGQSSGFYTPGFDVQGPSVPNPQSNYTAYTPDTYLVCVIGGEYAIPLFYYPDLQSLQWTATGLAEVRPAGTGGTSIITLIAKVASGATPIPGVALVFLTDVTVNSGGHDHDDVNRPKGKLNIVQGTTDASGEVKVTFTAPEVAGIHVIKATCATCSNSAAIKEIQVKVPDLLPISPYAPQNADGSFVYALTSVDKTHQGNGRYHVNQYYLTQQSQINLQSMISDFAAEGWGTVALNDASLYWGGRYDITSNWNAPHAGHREGREIDVSFARSGNPISASKQKVFYKKFCEAKTVSFPFSILHHYVKNPHFHVYLEKQTACWQSGN